MESIIPGRLPAAPDIDLSYSFTGILKTKINPIACKKKVLYK
jgi:hypothetical protein